MQFDSLYIFPITNEFELISKINLTIPDVVIDKCERFRKIGDRNNFIASRSILYQLASANSKTVSFGHFDYSKNGKPFLSEFSSFNISNTDGLVVVFVSNDEVGVDTEKIVPVRNQLEFERYFSSSEMLEINSSENNSIAFYYYWTIKEALVKYLGTGIQDLHYLKNLLYLNEKVLLYDETLYNYESFYFNKYMISCVRSQAKIKSPIKVFECRMNEDTTINFRELNYKVEKISLL